MCRKTPLADGLLQPAETAAEPAATEEAAGLAEAAPAEGTATADAAAAEVAQQAAPAAARQRRGGLSKRKRPRLDVNADGRPATQLPSRAVHALLQDRSSLLTSRGRGHLPHIDEVDFPTHSPPPSWGLLTLPPAQHGTSPSKQMLILSVVALTARMVKRWMKRHSP